MGLWFEMSRRIVLADAIRIAKDLERLYDVEDKGIVSYRNIKKYVFYNCGHERHTLYAYVELLTMFGLLTKDSSDKNLFHITYRTSPEYLESVKSSEVSPSAFRSLRDFM